MKRCSLLFAFLLLLCVSCSNSDLFSDSRQTSSNKCCFTKSDISSFKVNEEDINAYLRFKSLLNKDDSFEVKSVFPFPSEDKPFLYAINYSDCWELVSSDKRTAVVISYGEGEFDPNTENESMLAWVTYLGETVDVLSKTNYMPKNGEDYCRFWELLSSTNLKPITRSGPDTLYHPVPGHYELFQVDSAIITTEDIDHLISTNWGQDFPFNQYCPIDSSVINYPRCLAGCIPVAAGQIVFYYHYSGDACPEVYDSAYCNTREYNRTDWTKMIQLNKTDSNWAKFETSDSLRMAAVMLANFGKGIQLHYRSSGSGLYSIESLQDVIMDEYYFGSFYATFEFASFNPYDYLFELLQDGYPSILSIISNYNNPPVGHALVLDRYKKARTSYVFHYMYIPDDPNIIPLPEWDVDYVYQSPKVLYFGMKWGNRGLYDNSWHICTSDWRISSNIYDEKFELMTFRNDGGYPGEEEEEGQSILNPVL